MWEDSETPNTFTRYEPQELDEDKPVAFLVPGQPYIFDSKFYFRPAHDDELLRRHVDLNKHWPSFLRCLIIGKQGDMIKKLRISSNANVIQVAKDCSPGCNYRNVFIEGSLESYCLAKKMIYEIIDENNRAKRLPTYNLSHQLSSEPYIEIIVPENYIHLILGENFDYLQYITRESQAKVLVPTKCAPGTNNRYINVSGHPENINRAKKMIYEVLEPAYRKDAAANGITVPSHELIDLEFPYCSYFGLVLKVQLITMTACEGTCNSATAALKGLTLAGHDTFGSF